MKAKYVLNEIRKGENSLENIEVGKTSVLKGYAMAKRGGCLTELTLLSYLKGIGFGDKETITDISRVIEPPLSDYIIIDDFDAEFNPPIEEIVNQRGLKTYEKDKTDVESMVLTYNEEYHTGVVTRYFGNHDEYGDSYKYFVKVR